MCIAFFTLSQPGYKLILASNRDEFLARPTSPAKWHNFTNSPTGDNDDEHEGRVLSGIDLGAKNGGTWLGITKDLRIGLLTNVRLTPPTPPLKPSPNPPSRGLLLKDFLSPSPSLPRPGVHEYLKSHYPISGEYEGFNLLLFSLSKAHPEVGYLTNRPIPCLTDLHIPSANSKAPSVPQEEDDSGGSGCSKDDAHQIPTECFGISNSPMNEPWPKVKQGEERMVDTLKEWSAGNETDKELVERMFRVLSQNIPITKESDSKSSTTIPLITIPSRIAKGTSIPTPADQHLNQGNESEEKPRWYGTRTSTVIIVKENGETIFVERDILGLDEDGNPRKGSGERWVEFKADLDE